MLNRPDQLSISGLSTQSFNQFSCHLVKMDSFSYCFAQLPYFQFVIIVVSVAICSNRNKNFETKQYFYRFYNNIHATVLMDDQLVYLSSWILARKR